MPLLGDRLTIGRGTQNDLVLPERNISRRHAQLVRRGAVWLVEDLGSYTGTYLRGRRPSRPAPLRPGDVLVLGDEQLRVVAMTQQQQQQQPPDWIDYRVAGQIALAFFAGLGVLGLLAAILDSGPPIKRKRRT